jgi:hypothetical protein
MTVKNVGTRVRFASVAEGLNSLLFGSLPNLI